MLPNPFEMVKTQVYLNLVIDNDVHIQKGRTAKCLPLMEA